MAKKQLYKCSTVLWVLLQCLVLFRGDYVDGLKHYDTLGVSEDADEATIKKAYRTQALKWHPDRNLNDRKKAEQKFREVAEAYEILSDSEKRRKYDQFGENAFSGGTGGGGGGGGFRQGGFHGDPFEMFNMFFGDGGGFGRNVQWSTGGFGGGGRQRRRGGGSGGGGGDGCGAGGGGGRGGRGGRASSGGGGVYDGDTYVKDAAGIDLNDLSGLVHLVEFYAPWCGHCKNLAPKWRSVAKSLDGMVKVGAVNCDDHGSLCQSHGVKGYPTIKAFIPGKSSKGVSYQGDRSAGAIKDWALSLIPNEVTTLGRTKTLEPFFERCSGRGSNKVSWRLCLILYTDKQSTPPIFKSLSSIYKGKVAFGEIRSSNVGIAKHFNVTKSPSILAVCNGDAESKITYSGELKPSKIRSFLDEYIAGKKCDRAMKLDPSTDFSKLTISQMKAFLNDRGEMCVGCAEKIDYIEKVKGLVLASS